MAETAFDALKFTPQKGDLVGMMPGGGVLLGYEIIDQLGTVAIYP